MKKRILIMVTAAVLACVASGCGKAWQMDYGKPAAQFVQADVAEKGEPFIGKKITVKGTVSKVDVSTPRAAVVTLGEGITCNFGKMEKMAKGCEVGETVFIDGFLERCRDGDILLDPAGRRDPAAPFSAM